MSLIPRNNLFDIDRFFDDSFTPFAHRRGGASSFAPRVDVRERDEVFEISAELPGVDKKDLHVNVHNGVLTIEAETRTEDTEEKNGRIIRQERRYGKFMRSFELGKQVQENAISAKFENGVLTLTAPKASSEGQPAKRIDIQ